VLAAGARPFVGSSSHVLSPAHVIRSAIGVMEPRGGRAFVTPIE
jgi:poly-gamma-glutamate capsule biosynthesis protein CapA/YwtB (metallophosphatase superfamily)